MRHVTAKKASDIKLSGIKVEFDIVNDSTRAVILTDIDGNHVRFSSAYGLGVEVPEPPKTEEKHVLVVKGMPVAGDFEKVFDDKYEAETARCDARAAGAESAEVEKRNVVVVDDTVAGADIPF